MSNPRLWRMILPLLILWSAFGLRLYRLDFQSIWWDEGHSIFVAGHPIVNIPTLPAMDVHPPAYFVLLHFWQNLSGSSVFALRYLSVIFSLLTVALLWRFAHRLSKFSQPNPNTVQISPPNPPKGGEKNEIPPTGGLGGLATGHIYKRTSYLNSIGPSATLTTTLAALSPLYIAYAQEVRSYSLITFLALASTFALWQLLNGPANRTQWIIAYVSLTAACLYTHYFTIFLLLFQNLVWLSWIGYSYFTTRKFRVWAILWLGTQLAILLLFLPQLRLALRQISTYTNPNLTPPSLLEFISRSWQAYTVGLTLDPAPARWGMAIIAAVLIAGYWVLIPCPRFNTIQISPPSPPKGGEKSKIPPIGGLGGLTTGHIYKRTSYLNDIGPRLWPVTGFLTAWFLIPLAAYFLVLQRQPSFEPRYLMLVSPALFLLLGFSLTHSIFHAIRNTKYVFRIAYCVLLTLPFLTFILALHSYYTNETTFKDDSAGVATWLAAETTANNIVYVDVPHPFHYYAGHIPAPTRYLFVDIHTAADTLSREAVDKSRLFWVTWRGSDTDPRGVIPFLAEKAGRLAGQRDFRGYHVEWYNLAAPVTFSLPTHLDPIRATFGEVLRLDGQAHSPTISAGRPVWATLHFSLLRSTDVNYKASLRLRSETGEIVTQEDRDLLNDRHVRTAVWPMADPALNQAINVYLLPLPPEVSPGRYQLELVIYNAEPPYPSEGVSGLPSDDGVSAVLGFVTVEP